MTDHRKNIPALAYMNAQVLQQAELSKCIESIENKYDIPKGSFNIINSAYIVSLLYCLIVVPKELFVKEKIVSNISQSESKILGYFRNIEKCHDFDSNPIFHLIRHIRNSLAHVKFSIDDNGAFTFTDGEFNAVIDMNGLQGLLSSLGADLANLRNVK